jgi:hypothetical protein
LGFRFGFARSRLLHLAEEVATRKFLLLVDTFGPFVLNVVPEISVS